jgi:hypothetical protein
MNLHRRPSILSSCIVLLSLPAFVCGQGTGQSPAPATANGSQTQASKPRTKSGGRAASDPLAEARRATAISLITSLADEARGFRDEVLRARVQARAADALWETDAERARGLFRRAWDAADAVDRERLRRSEEERRAPSQREGAQVYDATRDVRGEVLRLAERRDRALGKEFLARLDAARRQDRDAAALKIDATPVNPNDAASVAALNEQRVNLAIELLQAGDTARAVGFAEPALRRISTHGMRFLSALRRKDAKAADAIYAPLLRGAMSDPSTDANTVSLLSSYLFTPGLIIELIPGGGYSINNNGDLPAPDNLPPALHAFFFQLAAQVFLRPLPPPEQDRNTSGRAGTCFMISHLLPLFEQYAPDKVPALRAQMAALTPDAPAEYRAEHPPVTEGLKPESESRYDGVQRALDKLGAAQTSTDRDAIYVEAAFAAQSENDPRAREFAEKIENAAARRRVRAFLDYSDISETLNKQEAETVVRLAKESDITSIQRVRFYTEAARLLATTDRARAIEVLDEATTEMRRIDGAAHDRTRAMLAIAMLLYKLDHARVWTLMPDVVKTINSIPDSTGENRRLTVKFPSRTMDTSESSDMLNFNLQPLFALLAGDDMDRAVELARSFTAEAPRAVATLAVAGAALKDRAQPKPQPKS